MGACEALAASEPAPDPLAYSWWVRWLWNRSGSME